MIKILKYATCGFITTDEATHISCDSDEIEMALKIFSKTYDVPRLTLNVGEKTIYLYNDKFAGYKRASLDLINNHDQIISFCCEKGVERIQSYRGLFNEIDKLLKT